MFEIKYKQCAMQNYLDIQLLTSTRKAWKIPNNEILINKSSWQNFRKQGVKRIQQANEALEGPCRGRRHLGGS